MPASVRAASAIVTNSVATNTAISVTPTLPAGTDVGDRVFIFCARLGTVATPTGWAVAQVTTSVGGGTLADTTGSRGVIAFTRDYDDDVWTMPTITAAATSNNTLIACAVTITKDPWETYEPVRVTTAGTSTASTTPSAQHNMSTSFPLGSVVMLWDVFPSDPGDLSDPTYTGNGLRTTFGTPVQEAATAGTTTGRDIYGALFSVSPIANTDGGSTNATHGLTTTVAQTFGFVGLRQGIIPPRPRRVGKRV